MADAMRYLVPLLLLLSSVPAQEVKHAPTVEQCRADQRLWLHKIENSPEILPDIGVLHDWQGEMFDCGVVDHDHSLYYTNVTFEVDAIQIMRLQHFIERHGLWDKFIEEDKAGKR